MLEKILIFIVFLGPLIFFHELGHFLFARLFGVRVEVFSIGFGPKIFRYKRKDTEYAISVIPLGGYVKMFGDDPFSEVQLSDAEKQVAFNHKPKWARFWIVFGGPLANLILAFFLYFGLLVGGEKVPQTKFGIIPESSHFYQKGLRSGDIIKKINDEKILSFDDLNISSSRVETIEVERNGKLEKVSLDQPLQGFIDEFVNITPAVRRPVVVNAKGEKFYISINQKPKTEEMSLEELMTTYQGQAYLYKFSEKDGAVHFDFESEQALKSENSASLNDLLISLGLYPVDLLVSSIVMDSPADKAGLKQGDILSSINGTPVKAFEELRDLIQKSPADQAVKVAYLTGGVKKEVEVKPEVKKVEGRELKTIGVYSAVDYLPQKLVVSKAESIGEAFVSAITRTWDGIVKTFSGYKKLITREVSLNNIGGPLAIGKVASDSFNISLSMFFRLMAIISINLGVINLFPIPVLDGGHIMFIVFEIFNRGPLSKRKLEIAQRFGVSVLFFLIFVALFNDITRLF